MPRDHARLNLDIWTDDDWRDLTWHAQWLYLKLLSSPSLTFAGVADWRPARIVQHAAGLTLTDLECMAAELIGGRFILVDPESEEVAIRSFVKHDGMMRSPNVAAALVKAHGAVASRALRGLIVGQLQRLRDVQPSLRGWARPDVIRLLEKRALTFDEALTEVWDSLPDALRDAPPRAVPLAGNPSGNPPGNPSQNPSQTPSGKGHPNPSGERP